MHKNICEFIMCSENFRPQASFKHSILVLDLVGFGKFLIPSDADAEAGNGYRAISGQNQYDAHLPQTIKKIYAIGLTGRYPFFSQNAKTPRGAYLSKEVLASPLMIIGT